MTGPPRRPAADSRATEPQGSAHRRALDELARRPLTVSELRSRLERRGHPGDEIDGALARLQRGGYLDDRRLALDYILVRATRLGHGRKRLLRELERRGVPAQAARDAWSEAEREHGLDARAVLEHAVRRRLERHGRSLDVKLFRRVYNAMLRAGFEPHAVRATLEPYLTRAGLSWTGESAEQAVRGGEPGLEDDETRP